MKISKIDENSGFHMVITLEPVEAPRRPLWSLWVCKNIYEDWRTTRECFQRYTKHIFRVFETGKLIFSRQKISTFSTKIQKKMKISKIDENPGFHMVITLEPVEASRRPLWSLWVCKSIYED